MRIESTPPLRPAAAKRDDRRPSRTAGFASSLEGEPAAMPVAGTGMAGAVEGLFALQEMPDALAGRRRAVARGTALLDRLEELHLALLGGGVSRARLADLERQLAEGRTKVEDARLGELLDQIELRVAVELAKFATVS
jgi:hypothetical protein